MNFLFRRSASIAAAPASKRALAAAIFSSEPLSAATAIHTFRASAVVPERPGFTCAPRRDLHFSAGPIGFRATDASQAQPESAVDDFYDEDGTPPAGTNGADEEGLEIAKLGIAKDIVDLLARRGITKLFPIQRAVLEPAMQGRDMIGRAKTGTGKTLAFGIPIMDKIIDFNTKHGRGRNPLALVLAPTRELARQVEKEFRESAPLDTLCVYGGTPIQQQMRTLDHGVDVVVGTPGRVIDLLNRGALVLSEVQFVVLDEADQMLAVGFADDVEKILEKLPLQRQSMMFSATMPPWIKTLTQKYLKNPVNIDLVGENDQKLAEGIALYSIASDRYAKPSILATLIKEHAKGGKCIVFTQTKRDADQLAYAMGRSLNCQPLHGDISQDRRERTLSNFRDGGFNILIATDVAARGLDVPNVDLVIHYELPNSSEIFVHRSGRTGRAGKKGTAILIYTQEQSRLVRGFEQDTGCRFTELPRISVEGGGEDMFGGLGGRFVGGGHMGGQGFGRGGSGGYGESSNYGRPRSYGDTGGFGSPSSGRSGGYGESRNGRFGSPGGSGSAGGSFGSGYGQSGSPGGSGSAGSSFGSAGFGRSGGFGDSGQEHLGSFPDFGTGRFGSFDNSGQGRSNNFGDSKADHYNSVGSFGGSRQESTDNSWPGRSFMSSS